MVVIEGTVCILHVGIIREFPKMARSRRGRLLEIWQHFAEKAHWWAETQIKYLLGDDSPAWEFLEQFRQTATQQPVVGRLGELRGYSSMTVVADYDIPVQAGESSTEEYAAWVVKFETRPGKFTCQRLVMEYRHECLARVYLDRFIPKTLRVIGHGLRNEASVLVYQQRAPGKQLRQISWREIAENPRLCVNLLEFCDGVLQMSRETGQVPDLSGTLPRVDHFSNIFWLSRNIVVDPLSAAVWLVDVGGKKGEESLRGGPLRSRLRTWFRLQTMRFFRWRVARFLTRHESTI